jgi:hypothetical protein
MGFAALDDRELKVAIERCSCDQVPRNFHDM